MTDSTVPQQQLDYITELLDSHGIAGIQPDDQGNPIQMNVIGRVVLALQQRKQFGGIIDTLNQRPPVTPDILTAKALLAEAFKPLMAFDQTADLRQRIKLFMEIK